MDTKRFTIMRQSKPSIGISEVSILENAANVADAYDRGKQAREKNENEADLIMVRDNTTGGLQDLDSFVTSHGY